MVVLRRQTAESVRDGVQTVLQLVSPRHNFEVAKDRVRQSTRVDVAARPQLSGAKFEVLARVEVVGRSVLLVGLSTWLQDGLRSTLNLQLALSRADTGRDEYVGGLSSQPCPDCQVSRVLKGRLVRPLPLFELPRTGLRSRHRLVSSQFLGLGLGASTRLCRASLSTGLSEFRSRASATRTWRTTRSRGRLSLPLQLSEQDRKLLFDDSLLCGADLLHLLLRLGQTRTSESLFPLV